MEPQSQTPRERTPRTSAEVSPASAPETVTQWEFERTGEAGRGGGGYLRDVSSGHALHVTGTDASGRYIPAHAVDASGQLLRSAPAMQFEIREVKQLLEILDLQEVQPGLGVYTRPGFRGEYRAQQEPDGTISIFYSGGQHLSGIAMPPQTFHHGIWDVHRQERGRAQAPQSPILPAPIQEETPPQLPDETPPTPTPVPPEPSTELQPAALPRPTQMATDTRSPVASTAIQTVSVVIPQEPSTSATESNNSRPQDGASASAAPTPNEAPPASAPARTPEVPPASEPESRSEQRTDAPGTASANSQPRPTPAPTAEELSSKLRQGMEKMLRGLLDLIPDERQAKKLADELTGIAMMERQGRLRPDARDEMLEAITTRVRRGSQFGIFGDWFGGFGQREATKTTLRSAYFQALGNVKTADELDQLSGVR